MKWLTQIAVRQLTFNSAALHIVALLFVQTTVCLGLASACPCGDIEKPVAPEPPLDAMAGLKFTYTKDYAQEFAKAIAAAKAVCLKHQNEANVAVVSDIDETLLDNRPEIERESGYKHGPQFGQWIEDRKSVV